MQQDNIPVIEKKKEQNERNSVLEASTLDKSGSQLFPTSVFN